jgi:hypothetical protein
MTETDFNQLLASVLAREAVEAAAIRDALERYKDTFRQGKCIAVPIQKDPADHIKMLAKKEDEQTILVFVGGIFFIREGTKYLDHNFSDCSSKSVITVKAARSLFVDCWHSWFSYYASWNISSVNVFVYQASEEDRLFRYLMDADIKVLNLSPAQKLLDPPLIPSSPPSLDP